MEFSAEQLGALTVSYAVRLGIAGLIWFVGTTIAKVICDAVRRVLRAQEGIDPSVANFAARA